MKDKFHLLCSFIYLTTIYCESTLLIEKRWAWGRNNHALWKFRYRGEMSMSTGSVSTVDKLA